MSGRTARIFVARWAALACGWACGLAISAAAVRAQAPAPQGERPPEARESAPRGGEPARNRERLADGLERSLDVLPRVEAELLAAQQKYREGVPAAEIVRDLSPAARRLLLVLSEARDGRGPEGRGPEGRGPDERGPEGMPPGQQAMDRELRRLEEGRASDGRPFRDGPEGPRMSREQALAEAQTLLQEELPEIAAGLREMREASPVLTDGLLLRLAPRLRDARAARSRDALLGQLKLDEVRTSVLVLRRMKDLRDASALPEAEREPARERVLAQLRDALAASFDTRMRLQRREIELIAERLERTRRTVEERAAQREEFLDRAIRRARDGQPPLPEDAR